MHFGGKAGSCAVPLCMAASIAAAMEADVSRQHASFGQCCEAAMLLSLPAEHPCMVVLCCCAAAAGVKPS
jgi:hypothetical protein